jgi:hypothetical protein
MTGTMGLYPGRRSRTRVPGMMRKDGFRSMHVGNRVSLSMKAVSCLPTCALLGLVLVTAPALAVEQCRFIQAKPEREACYARQEAELAAKRKPEPRQPKAMESLEQMSREDAALNRQLHSICRGC